MDVILDAKEYDNVKIVPSSDLLGDILSRFKKFACTFQERYKQRPDYIVCAPGRINLVGDHIDYHGFAVLPMAIEKSIWLGCCVNKPGTDSCHGLAIMNCKSNSYPTHTCKHSFLYGKELDKSHEWYNYVLCGYHGVLTSTLIGVEPSNVYNHAHKASVDTLRMLDAKLADLPQIKILVDSDLPVAAGLSSSSALVCGSAVAISLLLNYDLHNLGDSIEARELAEACSKFEHLIGTQGGGMDQAVIMTAQQDYAKYVEFVPRLMCENTRLPEGVLWIVSHSGVDYPKAATSGYNARVLETKLGAAIIAKSMKASDIALDKCITLAEIKSKLFYSWTAQEMVGYIRSEIFHNTNKFTMDEICERLEISRSELIEKFNTTESFIKDEMNDTLELLNRCEHVFEEAERVKIFKSICDTSISGTDIRLLGQLMTQSHYSLRDKYDCSHPALDKLVSVSLEAGALGSRLTGAGWGGCVVSLVEKSRCDTVYKCLQKVSKFVFSSKPMIGCQVIKVDQELYI